MLSLDLLLSAFRTLLVDDRTMIARRGGLNDGRCRFLTRAIAAAFLRAVAIGSILLRRLLQKKRSVALGAGFGDRLVPVNHITLRILRAAVEGFAAFRFLDDNLALATGARAGHPR